MDSDMWECVDSLSSRKIARTRTPMMVITHNQPYVLQPDSVSWLMRSRTGEGWGKEVLRHRLFKNALVGKDGADIHSDGHSSM